MLTTTRLERAAVRDMVEVRRDLHQHPELAFQEHRTARLVAETLRSLGLDEVREGVGRTGVLGMLRGARSGRTVLLRADMDALPLVEGDRGQPYRSSVDGVHHACGHDGHAAILLAVARLLSERRAEFAGTVVFVFQPAEEGAGGAVGMIEDGVLTNPRPDAVLGLHLWNSLPVGQVSIREGTVFACADGFAITLVGPGGHAAEPQETADPIVAAAHLVISLQTIVAREVSPFEPAALTVGSVHGGTASNVIPRELVLRGTVRSYDSALQERLLGRIEEVAHDVGRTFRVQASFEHAGGCPPCVNHPRTARALRDTAVALFGADRVVDTVRTTAADDMALFLQAAPGCYAFVGSGNAERGLDRPHHSPDFDFDEAALSIGAELLANGALNLLSEPVSTR